MHIKKLIWVGCISIFVLILVGTFSDFTLSDGVLASRKMVYSGIYSFFWPGVGKKEVKIVEGSYLKLEEFIFPSLSLYRESVGDKVGVQDPEGKPGQVDTEASENVSTETTSTDSKDLALEEEDKEEENTEEIPVIGSLVSATTKKVVIHRGKLNDFDYLRQNFYQIDNTTTIDAALLNAQALLSKDLSLTQEGEGPQILIYHTHSQEGYTDSVPGDEATSIFAVGTYLEELLTDLGYRVLYHKGKYDVEVRDYAYSQALPTLEKIMEENPSIELVIDLHRDGVREDLHLVTEVNGKDTARIMFFVGLSRTTSQGILPQYPNPSLENNLAMTLKLQLAAEEYYPGWARKVYLKGLRYNQHIAKTCILVEIGAQTNSLQEAINAMEPLADILHKVLQEK